MWPAPKKRRSLDTRDSPILKNVTNVTPKVTKYDCGSSGEWLCSRDEKPVKKQELSPFMGSPVDAKPVPRIKKKTSSVQSSAAQHDSPQNRFIKCSPVSRIVKEECFSPSASLETARRCTFPTVPVVKKSNSSNEWLHKNLADLSNKERLKQDPDVDYKYKPKSSTSTTLGSPLVKIQASPQQVKWSPQFASRKRAPLNSGSEIFDEFIVKIEVDEYPASPPKPKWKNSPASTPKSVRRSVNCYFSPPPPRRVKDSPASSVSSPNSRTHPRVRSSLPIWSSPVRVRDARLVKLEEDPNIDRCEFHELFLVESSQSQANSNPPRQTVSEALHNLIEDGAEQSQIDSFRYEILCTQGIMNDTCGISQNLVNCNHMDLPQTSKSAASLSHIRKNSSFRTGRLAKFLGSIRADRIFDRRSLSVAADDVDVVSSQRCWGITLAVLHSGEQLLSRSLQLPSVGCHNEDESSAIKKSQFSTANKEAATSSYIIDSFLPTESLRIGSASLPLGSAPISGAHLEERNTAAAGAFAQTSFSSHLTLALPLRRFDYSSILAGNSQSLADNCSYTCIIDPVVINR